MVYGTKLTSINTIRPVTIRVPWEPPDDFIYCHVGMFPWISYFLLDACYSCHSYTIWGDGMVGTTCNCNILYGKYYNVYRLPLYRRDEEETVTNATASLS